MEMGLGINTRNQIFSYMIINLKLNLGDGSLYGNANTNNESSFEINIQEAIDSTYYYSRGFEHESRSSRDFI